MGSHLPHFIGMSESCTAEEGIIKLQCNNKEHLKLLIIVGFISIAEINTQNYNVEEHKLVSCPYFGLHHKHCIMDLSFHIVFSTQ